MTDLVNKETSYKTVYLISYIIVLYLYKVDSSLATIWYKVRKTIICKS